MIRYRRRGGFCRLTTLPGMLSVLRMALLAAVAVCHPLSPAAGLAALVLSLAAGLAAHRLIYRYDMASLAGLRLHIIADALTAAIPLALVALQYAKLRFAACALLVLILPVSFRRLVKTKQPAL